MKPLITQLFPYAIERFKKASGEMPMHPSENPPQKMSGTNRLEQWEAPEQETLQQAMKKLAGKITGKLHRNNSDPNDFGNPLEDPELMSEVKRLAKIHSHPETGEELEPGEVLNGVLQAAGMPPLPISEEEKADGAEPHQRIVTNKAPSSGLTLGKKSKQLHPHHAIAQLDPQHREMVSDIADRLKSDPSFREGREFSQIVNEMAQASGMHPTEVVQTIENHAGIPHLPTPNGR